MLCTIDDYKNKIITVGVIKICMCVEVKLAKAFQLTTAYVQMKRRNDTQL